MVKNHLSRLDSPNSWSIRKKGIKFVKRPTTGPHSLGTGITLSLVLKSLLGVASSNKEVKKILYEGKVLVNNKIRKDPAFTVGIMDIIGVPVKKENYRLILDKKGKFTLVSIDEKDADKRLVKIVDKTIIKKGIVQLNNFDGGNILVDKDEYKTGDSLVISIKEDSIVDHLKYGKGATVYLMAGNKVGRVGTLEDIKDENRIQEIHDVTIFINLFFTSQTPHKQTVCCNHHEPQRFS